MRTHFFWSMSTAGLTAQEICLPTESPFLRGSYCHSMARSKRFPHDLEKLYFSMESTHVDHSFHSQQKVSPTQPLNIDRQKHSPCTHRLPPKKSRPTHLSLSFSAEPSTPSPCEDDQVVPSFQKLSMHERSSPPQTPGRCSKPLPPLPTQPDLSPEQAMDNEVEFFTSSDDSSCLVPDQCSKPSPFRRSFRDCGQINYAYFEGPTVQQRPHQPQLQPQRELNQEPPEPPETPAVVCPRQQDRAQRKLRRSHSGPAGSFNKPALLRLSCRHRHAPLDKPEVPPPVPPRLSKAVDYRRWSAEVSPGAYSDEDKPPKVPPREPLLRGSSRTPSPKSLPTYINGVMPPTQSFAPDPKYVSRVLQRQNSEGSPCIMPVIENGRQASNTHYYLLS